MLRTSTSDDRTATESIDHETEAAGFVMVDKPHPETEGNGERASLGWQNRISAARNFMDAEKFADARQMLLNALQLKPNDPLCRAMLAHCTAALDSNSLESLPMCEAAAREARRPELLYHLGSVHLLQENRRKAVQVLHEALTIDPRYAPILELLDSIGRRRPPVIPFLSRDNALNVRLGRLLRGKDKH
jgi:Tfp pilus assembly protein PilF